MQARSMVGMELIVKLGEAKARLPRPRARKAIRRSSGLTVGQVADLLAIDLATAWRWERGKVEPRGASRLLYAALLTKLAEKDTPPVPASGASDKTGGGGLDGSGYIGT